MNRKKCVRNVLLLILIAALLYVGDMFLGNPISYFRVKRHAEQYLEQAYPGQLQLQMDDIYYDWYNGGGYEIDVTSPVSRDTRFQLRYDRLGGFIQDTYEMYVASGNATLSRLYCEYAVLVDAALEEIVGNNICKPSLSAVDIYTGKPVPLPQGIDPAALTIDGEYDVAQLGWEYGYLDVSIYEEAGNVTIEKAAEYLLSIKVAMKEAGIGFSGIALYLSEKDTKDYRNSLSFEMIPYADLEAEDLAEHLKRFVVN